MLDMFPEWLVVHGPALLAVLPLMMGAVCAVLPRRFTGWTFAIATCAVLVVTSIGVMLSTWAVGPTVYEMGGWEPPRGISFNIDAANVPLVTLISSMALVCLLYARASVNVEIEPKKRAPFYGAFLIVLAGLVGIVLTGDAFNAFVFLEVSSISTYVLVAMGASRDRRALTAAFNYLILGSIGATFFVLGVGMLFAETGTLNMAEMSLILSQIDGGSRVAQIGYAFIAVGVGLKLAMFPLHTWLPSAYAHSPSFITAFLASTATKAALYLLLRFTFTVFDPSFDYVMTILTWLFTGAAVAAMLVASFSAIFQTDARRVLAYSSVAQVGYMLLGVGMVTTAGIAAGYLHLLNHAVIKGGLFVCLGAFWYRYGITRVSDFAGLGKLMPWTMAAFTISALSLIGVPFTAGFISKLNLALAAAERGWWWAIAVIVFSSVLAIFYMGRILTVAYFQAPPERALDVKREATPLMAVAMGTLAALSLLIGIFPEGIVMAAQGAAEAFLPLGGL